MTTDDIEFPDDGGYELDPISARDLKLLEQKEKFLELRAAHTGDLLAAYEVGWSPAELRRHMREDKVFMMLASEAEERGLDSIERSLYDLAEGVRVADGEGGVAYVAAPSLPAIQMVLYNRRRHRWMDVKRVETIGKVEITVEAKQEIRNAALSALRVSSIAELQAPIEEAEIVEDDE